jgi:hypothetical protein
MNWGKCPRHGTPIGITANCKLCMDEYDKLMEPYKEIEDEIITAILNNKEENKK